MAHFSKLDENNVVLAVHVVHNNELLDAKGNESEAKGVEFLTKLYGYKLWKQTSYNRKFRKNYAGIGYIYDSVRDAFIAPKPFSSWVLNENTCQWEPPVMRPNDGKNYHWNEPTTSWILVE